MTNIPGPRSSKRRAMMSVLHSIMLYGAEVWADALMVKKYCKKMSAVQWIGALREASAYRTVFEAAVMVIAGIIPIEILASERKRIFRRRAEENRADVRRQERASSLRLWEQRWRNNTTGRWTTRIIEEVIPWIERQHGEVNYHLTQFLSGHGHFNEYLHRRSRKNSPLCDYCNNVVDSAEHTFFSCNRFAEIRRTCEAALGVEITPDTIVAEMLQTETKWSLVANYVEEVLRTKKREEQEREEPNQ